MASSLECPGVIARCVEDAALVMEVICGKDIKDAMSVESKTEEFSKFQGLSKKEMKVGYSKKYLGEGINFEVKQVFRKVLNSLDNLGIEVTEVEIPDWEVDERIINIVYRSEVSSNLARYDGIRYGYLYKDTRSVFEQYYESRGKFGTEVKRQIVTDSLAVEESEKLGKLYIQAQKMRNVHREKWDRIFAKVDAMVSPATPNLALPKGFGRKCGFIGGKGIKKFIEEGKGYQYLSNMYSLPAVLYGFPAISVPIGLSEQNLPIGLNIFADRFEDKKVLQLAKLIESQVNFERNLDL